MPSETNKQLKAFKELLRRLDVRISFRWGRLGEKFEKVSPGKVRIPSLTKTAEYRIPDILLETELIEIKNAKRQRLTNQIKDFLLYCSQTHRRFILCTRKDTKLSAKLVEMAENGEIEIRHLSIIFTQDAQKKLWKALEPMIVEAMRKVFTKSKGDSESR